MGFSPSEVLISNSMPLLERRAAAPFYPKVFFSRAALYPRGNQDRPRKSQSRANTYCALCSSRIALQRHPFDLRYFFPASCRDCHAQSIGPVLLDCPGCSQSVASCRSRSVAPTASCQKDEVLRQSGSQSEIARLAGPEHAKDGDIAGSRVVAGVRVETVNHAMSLAGQFPVRLCSPRGHWHGASTRARIARLSRRKRRCARRA